MNAKASRANSNRQPTENDSFRLKTFCRGCCWFLLPDSTQNQHQLLDPHFKSLHIPTIMVNITPTQLRKAADIQEKIQSLQEELGQLLGGEVSTTAQTTEAPKTYKFSAYIRAKMRAAQQARWAKLKGAAPAATPAPKRKMSAQGLANIRAGVRKRMLAQAKGKAVQPAKRKVSAAAKARLSALAKARWAKVKAQGKARL